MTKDRNNELKSIIAVNMLPDKFKEKYMLTVLDYECTLNMELIRIKLPKGNYSVIIDLALKSGIDNRRFVKADVSNCKINIDSIRYCSDADQYTDIANDYLNLYPETVKNSILTESQKREIINHKRRLKNMTGEQKDSGKAEKIIQVYEEFLEMRDIKIDNHEIRLSIFGDDCDEKSKIYGSDYRQVYEDIDKILSDEESYSKRELIYSMIDVLDSFLIDRYINIDIYDNTNRMILYRKIKKAIESWDIVKS